MSMKKSHGFRLLTEKHTYSIYIHIYSYMNMSENTSEIQMVLKNYIFAPKDTFVMKRPSKTEKLSTSRKYFANFIQSKALKQ